MPQSVCRLCGNTAELQLSHVVPGFVYRWMRETSGSGYMRTTIAPNRRVQDGEKRYWLCAACEVRFNQVETTFATRIFHPYSSGKAVRFRYGHWLMQFGASVCWRVLRFYKEENLLGHFPADLLPSLDGAEQVWKELLLGRRLHPGQFEIHLLPLDAIKTARVEGLPPNINRYLMRAIDMDVVHGGNTAFAYSKLARFLFLGFTSLPQPKQWVGTKVHASEGMMKPRRYTFPEQLLNYLTHKARQTAKADASLSPRQREKINQTFIGNMDQLATSDQMRALQEDIRLFGEGTVFGTEEEKPGA